MTTCPICKIGSYSGHSESDGILSIECSNCGRYSITKDTLSDLEAVVARGNHRRETLAYAIRRRSRPDAWTRVTSELVDQVEKNAIELPGATEQVDNLLRWIAEHRGPGESADVRFERFQAIIGTATKAGFAWVTATAKDRGLIAGPRLDHQAMATLTLDGWKWYAEFGRYQRRRQAFMAMQFGDDRLDRIVDDYFRPAVRRAGFELVRLDDEPKAGIIDNRMRVEIRRSRLLVCDLTHDNSGAYFEAGFAEGLGLPVIYTCEAATLSGKKVHFDTRNCMIVSWAADDPARAAAALTATIRNTLPEEAALEDPE